VLKTVEIRSVRLKIGGRTRAVFNVKTEPDHRSSRDGFGLQAGRSLRATTLMLEPCAAAVASHETAERRRRSSVGRRTALFDVYNNVVTNEPSRDDVF